MKRCSWCNKLMVPLFGRPFSDGGTMHQRCAEYVDHIAAETQEQYSGWAAWRADESYEQFLMRIEGDAQDG